MDRFFFFSFSHVDDTLMSPEHVAGKRLQQVQSYDISKDVYNGNKMAEHIDDWHLKTFQARVDK